jgi:sortase A
VSFTTIRVAIGRVLLVLGVLVLLFIPYLLWGTGLTTARDQAALQSQFRAQLHRAGEHPATHPATAPPTHTPPRVAPTVAPPPVGGVVGTIDIPGIDLSMAIVEGTAAAQLSQGPGHYAGTPLPGEAGNVAIAGHRTTYLHPFYNLNELVAGSPVIITTLQGVFTYDVVSSQAVSPNDVAVVAPTATNQLTLTTCNPRYSASQRLVVTATLAASTLASNPTPTTTPATRTDPLQGAAVPTPASPAWWPAVLWGALLVGAVVGLWLAVRRLRRPGSLLVAVGGGLVSLVVVFLFFQAVTPLLPASY